MTDYGFKGFLRATRKAIVKLFEESSISNLNDKWIISEIWMHMVELFAKESLGLPNPTKKEVAIITLLLHPVFGPTKNKP